MSSSIFGGALALSLASGCGSSSDGGGGSSSGGCKQFSETICGKLNTCFPALMQMLYGDLATCTARSQIGCESATTAPGTNITSTDIASCASAYSALSCEALLSADEPEACNVPGDRADGQPCADGTQCTSTYCNVADNATCGTCAPQAAAGGSCSSDNGCQNGLICAGGVCATPVAAGGACTTGLQCAANLVCKSGSCATPATAGQSCDPQANECDFAGGLFCDPQSSVCKAISFADAGAACGLISGSIVACKAGGTCKGYTATTPGTCMATAADGSTCNADQGPDCLSPAECVQGTCQLPNPNSCG